jgi:predicted nucleic acid-binding OB-fold protein
MKYKFSRFENDSLKRYEFDSYEDVKSWIDQEIEKFKIVNRVRDEKKDRSFISFKSELESILNVEG